MSDALTIGRFLRCGLLAGLFLRGFGSSRFRSLFISETLLFGSSLCSSDLSRFLVSTPLLLRSRFRGSLLMGFFFGGFFRRGFGCGLFSEALLLGRLFGRSFGLSFFLGRFRDTRLLRFLFSDTLFFSSGAGSGFLLGLFFSGLRRRRLSQGALMFFFLASALLRGEFARFRFLGLALRFCFGSSFSRRSLFAGLLLGYSFLVGFLLCGQTRRFETLLLVGFALFVRLPLLVFDALCFGFETLAFLALRLGKRGRFTFLVLLLSLKLSLSFVSLTLCLFGQLHSPLGFRGLLLLLGSRRQDRVLGVLPSRFSVFFLHVFELTRDVVTAAARRRDRQSPDDDSLELAIGARQPVLQAIDQPKLACSPRRLLVGRRRLGRRLCLIGSILRHDKLRSPRCFQRVLVVEGDNGAKISVDNRQNGAPAHIRPVAGRVKRQRQQRCRNEQPGSTPRPRVAKRGFCCLF